MKLFVRFIFVFALLGTVKVFAGTDLAIPSSHCNCNDELDLLQGPSQINFGVYSGQCVDTCRYRRSAVLSLGKEAVISNFLHEKAYWKAHIPMAHVQSVEVGFEEFRPGISHVFLVFKFPPHSPVILSSQGKGPARQKITSLIISPEGVPPKTGKYNLIDAYLERYPVTIRAMSEQELVRWSVEHLKHKLKLFPVQIGQNQTQELLNLALNGIEQKSFKSKYKLFSNNCATNVIDWLDEVTKPNKLAAPLYYGFLYPIARALPITGPVGTYNILVSRNLILENSLRTLPKFTKPN